MSQTWKTTAWNELVRRRASVASMSRVLSGSGATCHDFMCCKSCGIRLQGTWSLFFFNHIFRDKTGKCCIPSSSWLSLQSAWMDFHPSPLQWRQGHSPPQPCQVEKAVDLHRVTLQRQESVSFFRFLILSLEPQVLQAYTTMPFVVYNRGPPPCVVRVDKGTRKFRIRQRVPVSCRPVKERKTYGNAADWKFESCKVWKTYH